MKACLLGVALGSLFSTVAIAQIPGQDPNWPCQQRLVTEETAATYWGTPLPASSDWRSDQRLSALVSEVASRDTPIETAEADIKRFSTSLPAKQHATLMAEAFMGIVDETNRQRAEVITRLEDLNIRQRNVAALASKASSEASAIPIDATGDDAARRADALQRNEFLTRTFDDTRKTVRYACEIPAELDSRLGKFAKIMQDHP